jgi:hypothetical protein
VFFWLRSSTIFIILWKSFLSCPLYIHNFESNFEVDLQNPTTLSFALFADPEGLHLFILILISCFQAHFLNSFPFTDLNQAIYFFISKFPSIFQYYFGKNYIHFQFIFDFYFINCWYDWVMQITQVWFFEFIYWYQEIIEADLLILKVTHFTSQGSLFYWNYSMIWSLTALENLIYSHRIISFIRWLDISHCLPASFNLNLGILSFWHLFYGTLSHYFYSQSYYFIIIFSLLFMAVNIKYFNHWNYSCWQLCSFLSAKNIECLNGQSFKINHLYMSLYSQL